MPTYDYRCDGCGHEMALFQSSTEDAKTTCPECGTEKLRRLIGSGAGIIFKGSGFYETDYKRARQKPSESETKDKPSEPSKPKKDDTSSSPPDKKSE